MRRIVDLRRGRAFAASTFLVMVCFSGTVPAQDPVEPKWTAEQKSHWSFIPPKRPSVPKTDPADRVFSPIDAFILESIKTAGLKPAAPADKLTLIRRVTFDLTGLPPTPEAVDAFLADQRPDAYERLVDQLLDSKAYGERFARFWLDLARYAESDGFKSDKTRPNAWRYRDWVIDAMNQDIPYDRFVELQLAGDEVRPGDADAFVATGFNRNWPFEDNNMVPGLNRQLMLDDMTDTTGSVFLGLTVGCARCHNHKFDPISQKDYYRIQAIFAAGTPKDDFPLASPMEIAMHANVDAEVKGRVDRVKRTMGVIEKPYLQKLLQERIAKLPEEAKKAFEADPIQRSASQDELVTKFTKVMKVDAATMKNRMAQPDRKVWEGHSKTMEGLTKLAPPQLPAASGMTETSGKVPDVRLLRKGNFKAPGGVVEPGFLSVLPNETARKVRFASDTSGRTGTTGRRKALVEWLLDRDNPLTARVMVNRMWLWHFGRGIVSTPSDFGTQGAEPTHPELLDWLATEFVAQGWSMKAMHKLMVTSATYRQSSTPDPKTIEADSENTMLGWYPRRRIEAESVRDALLAVSGKLEDRIGGPSVFPDLPPGMDTRGGWTRSESESDRNRRSIYVFVRRNLKYPLFDAFDSPDTNVTCAERLVSVNAPQALMILNSGLVLDLARSFAGRLYASVPDKNDQTALVKQAFRLSLSREPSADELKRSLAFLESQPEAISGSDKVLLPKPIPDGVVPARAAALVDFCHVLLNLNEFVFVD